MSALTGLAIGEIFAGGIADAQNKSRLNRAVSDAQAIINETAARRDLYKAERNEARVTNAANYAEKHALRAALAKLDPTHPLIANKHLQEKIQTAGEQIWVMSDGDGDSVAKVGREYKY